MTAAPLPDLFDAVTALAQALDDGDDLTSAARAVVEAKARFGQPALDLPYEDVPGAPIPGTVDLDKVADHLTVRAMTVPDIPGVAAAAFDFATTAPAPGLPPRGPGHPPRTIMAPVLIGTAPVLRKAGVIVRDTLNAAANRAEK